MDGRQILIVGTARSLRVRIQEKKQNRNSNNRKTRKRKCQISTCQAVGPKISGVISSVDPIICSDMKYSHIVGEPTKYYTVIY
jgi:hypothetical protein